MIFKLALLSGKGGSGKTTIALSLAKMLSDCGIKTLLIDCDTATNGATYFFEAKLEKKERYVSLASLFDVIVSPDATLLQVDNNFWFIPTNTSFPNDNDNTLYQNKNNFIKNFDILENKHGGFDVVIFDCQAGYSKILDTVLELSTTNLIVLEPDAISSSSVRVLYAQVSSLIEKVNTFQIFNKISDEEFDVYNKIIGGTTFMPLDPIKFNWEVRKAFAFAKVPEMVSTNAEFGNDVFKLANNLFRPLEKQLFDYKRKILTQEREEIELTMKKLEATRYDAVRHQRAYVQKDVSLSAFTLIFTVFITGMTVMVFFFSGWSIFRTDTYLMLLLFAVPIFTIPYLLYMRRKMDIRRTLRADMKDAQAKYDYEYSKLMKRISEIDKTMKNNENVC